MVRPHAARTLALALLALVATRGLAFANTTPAALDTTRLAREIARIADAAHPGVLGVGVEILGTGESWYRGGDRPMPMQSVFKAPLVAAALDAADRGRLHLDSTIVLTVNDLSPMYSPVRDAFPRRKAWTIEELATRAVETSDNTAADVLLARVGGPAALTAWLREHGVEGISVDRFERDLQPEILGLGRFQLVWVDPDSLDRARHAVPEAIQRRSLAAYLGGRRDTMTPRGAVAFLSALSAGRLGSAASTRRLLGWMTATVTGPNRLHAGLAKNTALAHKTGTGPTVLGVATATNDIGIVTLAGGQRIAIAALLAGSPAHEAARDSTLAAVARAVVRSLH